MKASMKQFVTAASLGLVLVFGVSTANAQDKQTTGTGEMKQSGSEAKQAGTSLGSNMKQGRVVRGGKHFGKHVGRAGKHFGLGTAKFFKKAVS